MLPLFCFKSSVKVIGLTYVKHGSEIKKSDKNAINQRVKKIKTPVQRIDKNNHHDRAESQTENCEQEYIRREKGRKFFIRKRIDELKHPDVSLSRHKNSRKRPLSVVRRDAVLMLSGVFLAAIIVVTVCMSGITAVSPYAASAEYGSVASDHGSSVTFIGTGIFSWPLDRDGRITSGFGIRTDPFLGGMKMHGGTDIAALSGTPVLAAADGTVIFSNWYDPDAGGYGLHVVIDHGAGLQTIYGHCSFLTVMEGQFVSRGEMIAGVGSSGNSTGPHLHFEVRINGIKTDPMQFFLRSEESGIISEENNTEEPS